MAKKRTTAYKKKLGTAPGSVIYTGKKESQKLYIESFSYTTESLEEKELLNIEEAFKDITSEAISWININGLNHTDAIEKIGEHYNLHSLVLEDIVNVGQRPKIDEYEDYLFVVLKMMYYDKDENVISEQVSFIMGENYVLTFQEAEGDVFDSLRDRIRSAKGRIRTLGSDYLLYALIDSVIDHYYVVIETMGNKIEDLEDSLFSGSSEKELSHQIQGLKREVLKVRRAIFPLREIG